MKKRGIGLMITAGGPPPPRYKALPDEPKESPRRAPSEEGGDPAPPKDVGRSEQDVAEAPMASASMGDMLSEVMAPLIEAGASEEQAKAMLSKMFSALAKCCGVEDSPVDHDAGGMDLEGGE
jgi:hypothetical protein